MKRILTYLFLLMLITFSACKKNNHSTPTQPDNPTPIDSVPQVDKDTASVISGMILPLFAYPHLTVIATNMNNNKPVSAKPDVNGKYSMKVTAGLYKITVDIAGTKFDPLLDLVTVARNQNVTIGLNVTGNSAIPLPKGEEKIIGTIIPAGEGAIVTAINHATGLRYDAVAESSGAFSIRDLPAGNYSITVLRGVKYTPEGQNSFFKTLENGQQFDVGKIMFYSNQDAASRFFISYTLDGVERLREAFVGTLYNQPDFRLTTYAKGPVKNYVLDRNEMLNVYQLLIKLDDVNGPGTYTCKGTATSKIIVSSRDLGMMVGYSRNLKIWSTTGSGGEGKVTITAMDPVTRTMSGTFSAAVVPENEYAKGNRVVANGKFTNFKY